MKNLSKILGVILFVNCGFAFSQQTNTWINYNQKYYKFDVRVDGFYRITPTTLSNAGVDLNSIHPNNFQIFVRGKEIPIHIENENDIDGVFNNNDFIEFYGQRNDGWADSLVYDDPNNLTTPVYSLFNDTISYFLTWNNQTNNKRFATVNDTSFSSYNSFPYFLKQMLLGGAGQYSYGIANSYGTYDPEYSKIEGYCGGTFSPTAPCTFQYPTKNIYTQGPECIYRCSFGSISDDPNASIDNRISTYSVIGATNNIIGDTAWNGYNLTKFEYHFSPTFLQSPTTQIANKIINLSTTNNKKVLLNNLDLIYPHTLDLEGLSSFKLIFPNDSTQQKSLYTFTNFSATTPVWFYDFTNKVRTPAALNGGSYKILSQNFGNSKSCYIVSEANIMNVSAVKPVTSTGIFTNFSQNHDANYLIITHRKLLTNVFSYANYRNTTGYVTLVADIDELYDQFAFGIKKNPLAIRKFVEFAATNFDSVPKHLFLIGKGILSSMSKIDTANYRRNMIPTWGYNGSDNLLTAKIQGSNGYAPKVSVGRLAASTPQQVDDYLQKVQQYENAPKAMWMKNVLHFAGGTSLGEQNQFLYFLDEYKKIYKDTLYGGNVTTFKKTSVDPIQITQADSIRKLIENGVSFMNFFGHAAGSSFDVSPEPPSAYNNQGKYPIVMANSCNVGDLHQPPTATYQFISEEYVFAQQRGAIAFLAQSSLGLASPNGIFTKELVKNVGQKMYGKTFGECIKEAINNVQQPNDDLLKETCLTMTLHGDPAIKPNYFENPDYSITQSSVSIEPAAVSTEQDSFKVNLIIKNEGAAINKNIIVQFRRYLPDSANFHTYIKTILAPKYIDTISVKIPVNEAFGGGSNKIEIFVDALNVVQELSENNNEIVFNFDIISKDIIPIYPYDFSVVPKNKISLKASTLDAFAPSRTYRFQIDTTDSYSSAFKKDTIITKGGGLVNWDLSFGLSDSTVYFWRVSPDSTATINFKWRENSFQYINSKIGWGQANFSQFKSNQYNLVKYNKPNRSFDFGLLTKSIIGRTFTAPDGQNPPANDLFATEYRIGTELAESAGNSYSPALHVAVIDSATLKPWQIRYVLNGVVQNPNHNFGNNNNNQSAQNHLNYFIFNPGNAAQMQGLKRMLQDSVPVGNYILVYTWIRGNFQSWADTSLRTMFENFGSDSVRYLPNNRGWIFFCKKGYPSTAKEINNSSPARFELTLTADMITSIRYGNVTSQLIGPAMRWDTLFWKAQSLEIPSQDSTRINLYGIKNSGQIDTLYLDTLAQNQFALNQIDANIYPYLKLDFYNRDDINQTSSQLKRWHILYEPVPECALNPNAGFVLSKKEVQQGEELFMKMPIVNASDANMDSLLVNYWLQKPDHSIVPISFPRQDSLLVAETQIPTLNIETRNLLGTYKLFIEANPLVANTNKYDQLEQYHFNNKASVSFNVTADKINPLLDVTFDGNHIMDGDIISPKPVINIQLKDENKYLVLNDTSSFRIFITEPGTTLPKRIYFVENGVEQLKFVKATLPENKARIEYAANFKIDGTYKLTVQASDLSNNRSGNNDYSINFEVINKSSITNVMNYPNPFTSSTKFIFTLTGSVMPSWFKIEIFTVSGKVVREITQQELGQIKIGKNITEYAWDGTDQYGDALGNGVYFYKVFTEINNEKIEHRESGADAFFKHEFGKMYLMR